ncbi:MAG: hypothetical protein ABFS12_03545 [Bacteroidota bacterium]
MQKNTKFILLLWGTNIALSLVLTIPIYSMLLDNLQHSILSNKLALNFNYFWYMQFRYLYEDLFDKLPFLFYSIVGVNVLIQTFYAGGLISIFNNPNKNHISDFFYGGVKYWYRFMKVTLVTLALFLIIFNINDLFALWIGNISENINSVWLDLGIRSIRYVILSILIIAVSIVSDYVDVYLALNDQTKVRKGFRATLKFLRGRITLIFITFMVVAVIGGLGVLIYNLIVIYVPRSPFYFLILTFFLQQMLIIFRLSITMLFHATEVYLYKDQAAEIITN